MTYQDIENACKEIKVVPIKGKDYVQVTERIKAFRRVLPQGTITTEILSLENGVVTMKASVYDGEVLLGTGLAQEKESSSYINKTSFIENCETSAVGRALGMCGFGIDASMASAEELVNAVINQEPEGKQESYKKAEKKTKEKVEEKLGDEKITAEEYQTLKSLVEKKQKNPQGYIKVLEDHFKVDSLEKINKAGYDALLSKLEGMPDVGVA